MNERLFFTVPASLLLWATAFALASLAMHREDFKPLQGRDLVTVHLISMSAAPPEPPKPRPEIRKPKPKPVARRKPIRAEPKPASVPQAPLKQEVKAAAPSPPQQVKEARTESHGATILYQPMPKIPDDLREEAFSDVATAEFHVAADGSATVELLKPSQNPRLNRLLLEALKNWRFSPAAENGKSVASTFRIRVHFAVE